MLLYIAAIAYLCFGHFDNLPHPDKHLFGIETDKLVHFCMFLPFPILSYFAIGKVPGTYGKALLLVLVIFLSGCIVAASTEIIQSRIPYRTADHLDFLADGIALGISSLAVFIIILVRHSKGGGR